MSAPNLDALANWALPILVLRATALLLLIGGSLRLLRRCSASTRHGVLVLGTLGLLALPFTSGGLLVIELALLPAREGAPVVPAPMAAPAPVAVLRSPVEVPEAPARASTWVPALLDIERGLPADEPAGANLTSGPAIETARPRAGWSWSAGLALLWLLGVLAALLHLAFSNWLVRRTVRRAAVLVDDDWLDDLAMLRSRMGVESSVRLLLSSSVAVPILQGQRRPVIVLPADAPAWPIERRRAVLLHELAHVQRCDYRTQTLARLARAVYWPNPLAWWLNSRQRAESERACDDRVLLAGMQAPDYAAQLLELARRLGQNPRPAAALAVVERSQLEVRLMALLDPGVPRRALSRPTQLLAASAVLGAVVTVGAVQPVERLRSASSSADLTQPVAAAAPLAATPPTPASALLRPAALSPRPVVAPTVTALAAPIETRATDTVAASPVSAVQQAVVAVPEPSAAPAPAPAARPASATPGLPVIRISTELVQLDAVVTDKRGTHVTDLRPEDFEIFEGGRRRVITHLTYVRTGEGRVEPVGDPATAVAAAADQTREPRTLVFVVDDLGLSFESAFRARKLLKAFAERGLSAGERAAIVMTSQLTRPAVTLSTDTGSLQLAAAAVRYNNSSRSAIARDYDALSGAFLKQTRSADYDQSAGLRTAPLSYNQDLTTRGGQLTIDALTSIKATIDELRGVPGRKAVILISEGFSALASQDAWRNLNHFMAGPFDGLFQDLNVQAALRSLTDLANRAQVVLYTLDPTGLETNGFSASDGSGYTDDLMAAAGTTTTQMRTRVRNVRHESLIELADQTGGLAIYNSNDLRAGLGQVLADHAGYYLIGYEPDQETFARKRGRADFHEFKVKVKRPGLQVRSRKGFYGVTDEQIAAVSR